MNANSLTTLDGMVFTNISSLKCVKSVQNLEIALRRTILIISDQQAVTGIALLASGFAQLVSGIASHHWQILVCLVWSPSLKPLTTLTVLRPTLMRIIILVHGGSYSCSLPRLCSWLLYCLRLIICGSQTLAWILFWRHFSLQSVTFVV